MPLADPSELACFTDDGEAIHVIVETPKGSRNKFAFDESRKASAEESPAGWDGVSI